MIIERRSYRKTPDGLLWLNEKPPESILIEFVLQKLEGIRSGNVENPPSVYAIEVYSNGVRESILLYVQLEEVMQRFFGLTNTVEFADIKINEEGDGLKEPTLQ